MIDKMLALIDTLSRFFMVSIDFSNPIIYHFGRLKVA